MRRLGGCCQRLLVVYTFGLDLDIEVNNDLDLILEGIGQGFDRSGKHYSAYEEAHCTFGSLSMGLLLL